MTILDVNGEITAGGGTSELRSAIQQLLEAGRSTSFFEICYVRLRVNFREVSNGEDCSKDSPCNRYREGRQRRPKRRPAFSLDLKRRESQLTGTRQLSNSVHSSWVARLKAQTARFRIWEYVETAGKLVPQRELNLDTPEIVSIQWTVHLANRKASFSSSTEVRVDPTILLR